MKRFKLLFVSLVLIICGCLCVACGNSNNDNIIRAELVQKDYIESESDIGKSKYYETEYIKIWFDEEWFGKRIYVEIFDGAGQTLLNTISNDSIKAQRLANWGNSGYDIAPNTYFYIDNLLFKLDDGYSRFLTSEYDTLRLRICYDKNGTEPIKLAEYVVHFKQSEFVSYI